MWGIDAMDGEIGRIESDWAFRAGRVAPAPRRRDGEKRDFAEELEERAPGERDGDDAQTSFEKTEAPAKHPHAAGEPGSRIDVTA